MKPYRRHVIISDKFGMFALIIVPFDLDSIEESNSVLKTSPKFIYVFELMNDTRNWLDHLGPSKHTIDIKTYNSLSVNIIFIYSNILAFIL